MPGNARDPTVTRYTSPSDDQIGRWLAAIRDGDVVAFEAIFDAYYARLVVFALGHLAVPDVAEEIVQDIFLSVWIRRVELPANLALTAYLFQSVRNRVHNARRTLRFERAPGDEGVYEPTLSSVQIPSCHRADDELNEHDLAAAVARALASLPPRPREVFTLNRHQHLSYADIATVLGISVKTVEMHMARALTVLRAQLADWRR